jgi:hypothetical protein
MSDSIESPPSGNVDHIARELRERVPSNISQLDDMGDAELIEEQIVLAQEALALSSANGDDRMHICLLLADLLRQRFDASVDDRLLQQIIGLQREALALCDEDHPHRARAGGNLAYSLRTRYERTGDVRLLDEAIELEREALRLRPEGHPYRSLCCGNLAGSLKMRHEWTGEICHLDEAIEFEHEALRLNPEGHPDRAWSCGNLANSLKTRYQLIDDVHFLDQAIDLEREVLLLCPAGHSYHSTSCGNLAASLTMHYGRTGDVRILDEVVSLQQEAVVTSPPHTVWSHLTNIAWVHLQNTSNLYNVSKAIEFMSLSLQNEPDDTLAFLKILLLLLEEIWGCDAIEKHTELTTVYQRIVNFLPVLAHPALELQPQLQAMKGFTRLGSDAFVNAALAGACSSGLEALELAQSVIWSQSLYRRDPQLKDVPEQYIDELHRLLQAVATRSAVESHSVAETTGHPHDVLHANSSQLYALLRDIRASPGLHRFMLGETFETLRSVASHHPVVVLVGARGHYYALVMAPSIAQHALMPLDMTAEDELSLSLTKNILTQSRGGIVNQPTVDRAMRISVPSSAHALERQFKALWNKIVKPVLDHLDLKVSECDNVIS